MGIGEWSALGCAVAWAVSVIFFKRVGASVNPFSLNLFKNTLGLILFIPTWAILGPWPVDLPATRDVLLLLLSGFLGIAVADTIFLRGLNLTGAGLTAVVECLYSPFVLLFSWTFLGERLQGKQLMGAGLVLAAVLWASLDGLRIRQKPKSLMVGAGLVALSMFLMAVGIVIAKPVLPHLPLLFAVEIRLVAGTLGLWMLVPVVGLGRAKPLHFLKTRHWRSLVIGSFVGAYLSMVLWLAGVKETQASVAAVLNQTSTLFTLLLAALFLGEPLTRGRVAAALLATGGVVLMTLT
ncbi:MAG TPA: DMT family transporter [Bdellovibrionota bacterium]|nr:DMT family transporter [Bdellovibrionota bacterium]